MTKHDPFLVRIQAFDKAEGGGVLIRKVAKGYSLFHEDNGEPMARLRPTGRADFGPLVMPLDEALEYVAKDPEGIFWR